MVLWQQVDSIQSEVLLEPPFTRTIILSTLRDIVFIRARGDAL